MNKYQEALDRVKDDNLEYLQNSGKCLDIELLQELVDKATPKKAIWDLDPLAWNENEKLPFCPSCKRRVKVDCCCHNNDCRQAIDWSKDNE
jgi:hypothetical protein